MRSANLIGQERSSDRIDLYFIFQWTRSVFMRGGAIPRAIHDRTTFVILWREMDSLQLLTVYLTLTPIFSGRKAKINLHTTPESTVVMPISCLLRSIHNSVSQPAKWCDHPGSITSCTCACFVCFQSSPAIKSFLQLTDCCLVYPTLSAIRLCFNHSIKIAQFLFAGVMLSSPM